MLLSDLLRLKFGKIFLLEKPLSCVDESNDALKLALS